MIPLIAIQSPPQFGVGYRAGDIGFTMTRDSIISDGINWFEHWERAGDIEVSHVFVVTGDDELVEAHIQHGVQRDCISKYWNNPNVIVYFRRPWGLKRGVDVLKIVTAAKSKIGCPYARGLIAADLLADSFLGHWANTVFKRWPDRFIRALLNRPDQFICSELGAYTLAKAGYSSGCLADHRLDEIDPQLLFEDERLFENEIRAVNPAVTTNAIAK